MDITKFQLLSKEIFENLAAKHSAHSVSIYIPTYKKGKEQNEHLAQSNLKRCIRNVHAELKKYSGLTILDWTQSCEI